MARVTINDCLKFVSDQSRFKLINLASMRTSQLQTNGTIKPLLDRDNDKETVISLREIEEGLVTSENICSFAKKPEAEPTEPEAPVAPTITIEPAETILLATPPANQPTQDPQEMPKLIITPPPAPESEDEPQSE